MKLSEKETNFKNDNETNDNMLPNNEMHKQN